MKRFLSTTSTPEVIKFMKTLAECSVCRKVPRDGVVMLQCVNGHNVCATCKGQLDTDNSKCPAGQCDFDHQPRPNTTVARIVDMLPIGCRYSAMKDIYHAGNHSDCKFESDDGDVLRQHEATCPSRPVPCPSYKCEESVSANRMVQHLIKEHHATAETKNAEQDINSVQENFSLMKMDPGLPLVRTFNTHLTEANVGWVLPVMGVPTLKTLYFWLQMVAHSSVTEKLRCKITLRSAKEIGADLCLQFDAPVYPIDWNKERILADERCARVSTEELMEINPSGPYSYTVMFEIVNAED